MRGSMGLRWKMLRVNDDVPRVFLPPPCEAHAPPTSGRAPGNIWNTFFACLSPCCSYHRCLRGRLLPGNVKTISGQFRRSDLCTEHRLNVRTPPLANARLYSGDLWRLDSHEIYARSIRGFRTSFPPFFRGTKPSLYILFRTVILPHADHLLILPRQVNVLHIRALVKADAVVLFDSYGSSDSRLHSVFLYHLEVRSHALR
jgi:hypothetical protein